MHTSLLMNHFASSPPLLCILTNYKNTFLRHRFSSVVFYSNSKSRHWNYKIQYPLNNYFSGVTHSGIPGTSDSDSPTQNEKCKCPSVTNRLLFIYFGIPISILFLTRASQCTDKCPELYLEEQQYLRSGAHVARAGFSLFLKRNTEHVHIWVNFMSGIWVCHQNVCSPLSSGCQCSRGNIWNSS